MTTIWIFCLILGACYAQSLGKIYIPNLRVNQIKEVIDKDVLKNEVLKKDLKVVGAGTKDVIKSEDKDIKHVLSETRKLADKIDVKPIENSSKKILKEIGTVYPHIKSNSSGCQCLNYDCGCCAHMELEKIGLNDTGCVNVSYLPDQYGVSLTLSLDDHILINETISAKNPPPICVAVPHLKEYASLCIRFYDLDIVNKTFSGCIKIEVRLVEVIEEDIPIGCFHLKPPAKWNQAQLLASENAIKNLIYKIYEEV